MSLHYLVRLEKWNKYLVAPEEPSDTFNTLVDRLPREFSTGTGQC